jgi:hypothetical protein
MRGFAICTSVKIVIGLSNKKNEMGGACGKYGGDDSCIHGCGGKNRGKNDLEDLRVDRETILK